jgi:ABC-type Mn2+/Zn2+ transport system permease subunit
MFVFRLLLVTMFGVLLVYTAVTIENHGWDLMSIFFGDIATVTWPGQFNLDFMFMLMLSGLWVAWRHRFSAAGLGLGVVAVFGGAGFLTLYLFVVSLRAHGDMRAVLLGDRVSLN